MGRRDDAHVRHGRTRQGERDSLEEAEEIGVYLRGNAITIVQRFYTVDPVSRATTPADPTTVTFTVRDPDGVETSYTGASPNVTNPEVGLFLCALGAQLPTGEYAWAAVGTGAVEATGEGTFTILPSGVLPPAYPTTAEYGPCSGWVDGAFVADWDTTLGVGSSTYLLDDVASMASQLMYELTARQFQGVCQRKVRPCRSSCSCFGLSSSIGLGPWAFGAYGAWGGWTWGNECGDTCGCGSESYIELGGYPVRQIIEVKIDGVVVSPVAGASAPDGNPAHVGGYRLDGRQRIIRLADPTTTPPRDQFWPACQDLSLADTEAGTFSVVYEWGAEPPALGKQAAAQLAAELWKASPANQGECRLPGRVTKIVRQGITMDRVSPLAELLRTGATGLALVDAFIAMVNPQGALRRSAVYSPDTQPKARQVGNDEYGS